MGTLNTKMILIVVGEKKNAVKSNFVMIAYTNHKEKITTPISVVMNLDLISRMFIVLMPSFLDISFLASRNLTLTMYNR